jgi:transcription elongation factor Elf1
MKGSEKKLEEKLEWKIRKEQLSRMFNCTSCKYIRFDHNDSQEKEKCRIAGNYTEVNQEMKELIEEYNLKGVCEYWMEK